MVRQSGQRKAPARPVRWVLGHGDEIVKCFWDGVHLVMEDDVQTFTIGKLQVRQLFVRLKGLYRD